MPGVGKTARYPAYCRCYSATSRTASRKLNGYRLDINERI
nr:MAG TPA: NACHT domain protein [Bacteriophage sp.]